MQDIEGTVTSSIPLSEQDLRSCFIISISFPANAAPCKISRHRFLATTQIGEETRSRGQQHAPHLHYQLRLNYIPGMGERTIRGGGHGKLTGPSPSSSYLSPLSRNWLEASLHSSRILLGKKSSVGTFPIPQTLPVMRTYHLGGVSGKKQVYTETELTMESP